MGFRWNRLPLVLAAVALVVAACDWPPPPTVEERMRAVGLPLESLMQVDAGTQITVRVADGVPELIVFDTRGPWGPSMVTVQADRPAAGGGMLGVDGAILFGAGQGPVDQIIVDAPGATSRVVNPSVDGWVIVLPDRTSVWDLHWKLVGPDGSTIYDTVGTGFPAGWVEVDADRRLMVHVEDGTPELRRYSRNAYGGADLQVWPAAKTKSGSYVGEVVDDGFTYLFGVAQSGESWPAVMTPGLRVEEAGPERQEWAIVVPDAIGMAGLEWMHADWDGSTWRGYGGGPAWRYAVGDESRGLYVRNDANAPVEIWLSQPGAEDRSIGAVSQGSEVILWTGTAFDSQKVQSQVLRSDDCASGTVIARDSAGKTIAERRLSCDPAFAMWVVGGAN